jgi:hypothetical protein
VFSKRPDGDALRLIITSLHVRQVMQQCSLNDAQAQKILSAEPGAEPAIIASAVASCRKTAEEFSVPSDTSCEGWLPDEEGSSGRGCCCLIVILAIFGALFYGVFKLVAG